MNLIKQLFCKHKPDFEVEGKWVKVTCLKCGKTKWAFRGTLKEYLHEITKP